MKAVIKVIPIIFIIAAFTAILSVNILSITIPVNDIRSVLIRQYQIDGGNYSWVTPSWNFTDDVITIDPVTSGVNALQFRIYFDPVDINSLSIKFKLKYTGSYSLSHAGTDYAYYNSNKSLGALSYSLSSNIISYEYYKRDVSYKDVTNLSFELKPSYLNGTITIYNIQIVINDYIYEINNDVEQIKSDISDIKDIISGTETIAIDNSGEDNLLDKLDEETGVINDMIDEFRAFDISRYTGGIYAIMYMSTPWTNQEWYKAVLVVLLTLFALITVVRGLRR